MKHFESQATKWSLGYIWVLASLFITLGFCSRLVAMTADTNDSTNAAISKSSYNNANNRPDPFLPVKLKHQNVESKVILDDRELHLQGILWHPTTPAAIVNRQRIGLNETVTLKLSTGNCAVKVVAVDRDKVALMIDGRQVELRMER